MHYFKVTMENERYYFSFYNGDDRDESTMDGMEYIVTRHLKNSDDTEQDIINEVEDIPEIDGELFGGELFHGLVLHFISRDSRYSVMTGGEPWSGLTVSMSDEDYGRMVLLDRHSQNVTITFDIHEFDVIFEKIELN